jgi:hypothetical protein
MKIVTIGCEHNTAQIKLRISESNLCCIQCGLIQIIMSSSQAARVRCHCHCMSTQLYYDRRNDKPLAFMTVDPSQVDLRGEYIQTWSIG